LGGHYFGETSLGVFIYFKFVSYILLGSQHTLLHLLGKGGDIPKGFLERAAKIE